MHVRVSKRKKSKKKIFRDQQSLPVKKVEVFVQNIFFHKQFLIYKKIIYFSESIFPGVTDNILEKYVNLI